MLYRRARARHHHHLTIPRVSRLLGSRNAKVAVAISLTAVVAAGGLIALRSRPAKNTLHFVRVNDSDYAYSGKIPNVQMDTQLGYKNDSIAVRVARAQTSIEFVTPFSSASIQNPGNADIVYSIKGNGPSYRYQLTPDGLKETITLAQRSDTNRFTSVMRTNGLVINKTSDGLPVFTDHSGTYQFHFARPFAEDGSGNRTYNVKYSIVPSRDLNANNVLGIETKRVIGRQIVSGLGISGQTLTDSTYTVVMEVDNSWLTDPKRIFPVKIDPTITHNSSSTFATGTTNRVFDTGSGSNPNLTTYYQELPTDPYTGLLWHLNETSNGTCTGSKDVCDSSGNANQGTAVGTTIVTSGQRLGAAARSFNGSSDYVYANTAYPATSGPNNFTQELWFKTTTTQGGGMLTFTDTLTGPGGNSDRIIYMNNSGQIYFGVLTPSPGAILTTIHTPNSYNDGNWHHVATTLSSGVGGAIYLDGFLATSSASLTAGSTGESYWKIGFDANINPFWPSPPTSLYFNGTIDEVRVSYIVRTSEEIKADAQRFPYSVYTSPVMDLSKATAFNSLSWDERGVTTGNGETASNSSNLVAEWKLNETSGTVATNTGPCGGTPANCNGTLTNFASTASQDQAPGTGWTAVNRRWGAGALMFDGTDDYVDVGNNSVIQPTSAITLDTWIKVTDVNSLQTFIHQDYIFNSKKGYELFISGGAVTLRLGNGAAFFDASYSAIPYIGQWTNVVGTWDGTNMYLYVNGALRATTAFAGPISYTAANHTFLGRLYDNVSVNVYFKGVMDVTRIYSRALPAHEILSNYNAANMEFETRVGNSTTPDDGTWEVWRPVTSEVQIDSMDSAARFNDGIYNSTYDWTVTNPNYDQNWIKYNNTPPAPCDSPNSCGNQGSLGIGSAGKSDSNHVYNPVVILDGSTYKMWYTCQDATNTRGCYATSPDGLTWTKLDNVKADNINCDSGVACGGNGLLGLGTTGGDTTHSGYRPAVIKDGSTYKMWYSGYNGNWRIFYATSPDGLTWTKLDNSVPTPSNTTGTNGRIPLGTSGADQIHAFNPTVIKDGSTYRMWYEGISAGSVYSILEATSSDGLTWTKVDNSVPTASNTCSTNGRIPLGGAGTFDSNYLETTSVVKDGPIYKMWYSGETTTNERIGYATSTDGLTFCKVNNAIPSASNIYATDGRLPLGSSGGDVTHALYMTVIKVGNSFLMWYSGHDGSTYRIYHARMSQPPVATSNDSIIKSEGTASRTLTLGTTGLSENSLVGQWHLDETGGTAGDDYYLKDTSGNNNNAGSDGPTTVVEGVAGKARSFGGASYLRVPDSASLKMSRGLTLEAWIKPTVVSGTQEIIIKYNAGLSTGYFLRLAGTSLSFMHQSVDQQVANAVTQPNQWYHIVGSWDGSNDRLYVNGVLLSAPAQATLMSQQADNLNIGGWGNANTQFFTGSIDEVRIFNRALTDEEVDEEYRSGSSHHISKTIASTDISSATKVPFYIASDRQGRIGDLTVGNSAFANYETDASTVGLWHLEEKSGSGGYIKDSSGQGANGTPTGSAPINGAIGKARFFAGAGNTIAMSSVNVDTTASATNTVDFWMNWDGTGTGSRMPVGFAVYDLDLFTANCFGFNTGNGEVLGTTITLPSSQWIYVAAVFINAQPTTSNVLLYINGVLQPLSLCTGAATLSRTVSNTFNISGWPTDANQKFNGSIDEVRVSRGTRTADQIRQAYEVGRRTHPIIIDFKAGLASSGQITGTSTKSFTIDSTQFGGSNMGSNLYSGDKIILRENFGGTTYQAQGTVTSITLATGATVVNAWDTGSTFPPNGYSSNATVFKWQREWWDPTGVSFSTHRNAVTQLTFRPTGYAQGANIWLDDLRYGGPYLTTPTGSTVTSSTGDRYFQYRAIQSSTDTQVSSSLVSVTLDYNANSVPTTPTLDSPTDTATGVALAPQLKTTATDADGDYLRYKIQLCTDVAMTLNCQTFDQTISQTGWSGQNTQTSTAYTSGTQATYTIQTPLTAGTTYYWRSYAIDPGGTNVFSATQSPAHSFTVSGVPTAPSSLLTNGLTNPTGVAPGSTPYFSAIYNDTDDNATQAAIQVSTSADFSAPITHWDSGFAPITPTAPGNRSPNINYGGATLQANRTFFWRIRFMDAAGNIGAWSSPAQFTTTQLFAADCVLQKNNTNNQIIVRWNNTNTVNDGYTIERSVDGGAFAPFTTTGPSGTSATDGTVSNGHTYTYRVYATLGAQQSEKCTSITLSLQTGNVKLK